MPEPEPSGQHAEKLQGHYQGQSPEEDSSSAPGRVVHHEYTLNWPPLLEHLGASLLVTTYQAGKVVVVRSEGKTLALTYHNFEKAMGLAVAPGRLAVGGRASVWLLQNAPAIAPQLPPQGAHDACFLARSARFTGEIQGHELSWQGDQLWVVNTLFSCLCTLDDRHSFVPRWKPPFISQLAPEDRCHLNGMAFDQGAPRFVTLLGRTNERGGWRPGKASGGALLDVPSGETVLTGLSMPHSPRVHQGRIWLLDSGTGRLVVADPDRGSVDTVAQLPGYTRGLALADRFAFVGLSRIRETSTFGGVPIAESRDSLKCGVAVVDLATGQQMALLQFHSGIEEIFDVQLLPGVRSPIISGPYPELDGSEPIWLAPPL